MSARPLASLSAGKDSESECRNILNEKLNETKSNRSIFWGFLQTFLLETFLKPHLYILIPNLLKNNGAVLKKRTPLIRGSPSLRSVLFTHYVLP